MFDFMFGGKRKLELIRELIEQRMRESGFDDMESRLKVKQLGNLKLIGTPEGAIVTIVDTALKLQRNGALISQIIASIENHRRSLGHNPSDYEDILAMARQSVDKAGNAMPIYAMYRVNIENPGLLTTEQFESAFIQAVQVLSK